MAKNNESDKSADEIAGTVEGHGNEALQDAVIARQLGRQRKIRIRIASGRDSHERCPVPVAVNGREFLIERDKEVEVPEGVLNVLLLANMQVAETGTMARQSVTSFHSAPRFALTVLGPVGEAAEA